MLYIKTIKKTELKVLIKIVMEISLVSLLTFISCNISNDKAFDFYTKYNNKDFIKKYSYFSIYPFRENSFIVQDYRFNNIKFVYKKKETINFLDSEAYFDSLTKIFNYDVKMHLVKDIQKFNALGIFAIRNFYNNSIIEFSLTYNERLYYISSPDTMDIYSKKLLNDMIGKQYKKFDSNWIFKKFI